jgi:DNA-3-methyladenine glycosylase I
MLQFTDDGRQCCGWPGNDEQYQHYHDTEWGRPVVDSRALFEKMCLEGFQSGLSWLTILRKRENFRAAFSFFDHTVVSEFGENEISALLANAGIVRHRGKIEAVINNAQRLVEMEERGISLSDFLWSFAPRVPYGRTDISEGEFSIVSQSPEATMLSKELKRQGWKFVGPTTMYSMMQSMGMVNDHFAGCYVRDECEHQRGLTLRDFAREAK